MPSCDEIIKSCRRLSDGERFFSCDEQTCFKYFPDEEQYKAHLKLHEIALHS